MEPKTNLTTSLTVTALVRQLRRTERYEEWKRAVFIRDRFTCQHCGARNGRKRIIEAHHLIELSTLVKNHCIMSVEEAQVCSLLWEIDNGQTLCRSCHEQTDSYPKNFIGQKKKPRGIITDAKKKAIITAYNEGMATRTIADQVNLSQATVANVLKKQGLDLTRKALTDAQIEYISQAYLSGKTTKEIGKEIGFSGISVGNTLRKLGVQTRDPHQHRLSDEQQNRVVDDYKSGASSDVIARKLGVGSTTVLQTLERHGIKRRGLWPKQEKPEGQLFDPNFDCQDLPDCQFAGIYLFTNKISGKIYIGQSRNIYKRYYQHREMRAPGMFTKALKKYGIGNFTLTVLERIDKFSQLDSREQYWLDFYGSYHPEVGYNIRKRVGWRPPDNPGLDCCPVFSPGANLPNSCP